MSDVVYRLCSLCRQMLSGLHVGTNLDVFTLLFALMSGRFLFSRGAVFPAIQSLGLEPAVVRRTQAALQYRRIDTQRLVDAWQKAVREAGCFSPRVYDGFRPVACDLIGFFRRRLADCTNKHYNSHADKAQPAVVLAVIAEVGSVGPSRLALPRLLLRAEPGQTDADVSRRAVVSAKQVLLPDDALIVDAGFGMSVLVAEQIPHFVARQKSNMTARRNRLPARKAGPGRPPEYGEIVRPLPHSNGGQAGTKPDDVARWQDGRYSVQANIYNDLVARDAKPGGPSFRVIVIHHPRYQKPLVLATNLQIRAYAVWKLYTDRWPIEQLPLAAKQMLGAEHSFVHGSQSRFRLPELALLAGNLLSYVAATSQATPTGFWDRCARPTCGRLRRVLMGINFSELPVPHDELRKKASVTQHLPKGVAAHRRSASDQRGVSARVAQST